MPSVESVKSQVSRLFIDLVLIIEWAWKNSLELDFLRVKIFCVLYENLLTGEKEGEGELNNSHQLVHCSCCSSV